MAFLLMFLFGGVAFLMSKPLTVQAQDNDAFSYPKHGDVVDGEQRYVLYARTIPGATHHLVWMRQGGVTYENWADTRTWENFLILNTDHPKHSHFELNRPVEFGVRGWVNGQWTPEKTIWITPAKPEVRNMYYQIKRTDLIQQGGYGAELSGIYTKTWSSTALGCLLPGEVASTVWVDGYKIVFRDGSDVYNFHTAGTHRVKYCPN